MKSLLFVLLAALTLPAWAQQPATAEPVTGEVRKVDKDAKKITIKHGEIKSLDMPSMTMVFQVADPAELDRVKAGDKIVFKAARSSGGAFMASELKPDAKPDAKPESK